MTTNNNSDPDDTFCQAQVDVQKMIDRLKDQEEPSDENE